jgi:peroxiredoxin
VAKAYEDRMVEFQKAYEDRGVRLVAINVNNGERDELPAMKERAEEKEFNFAYVDDPSQESARQYGAKVTPHVFVLDKDRKVAYVGAFDDNQDAEKVEVHYVKDAVDAVLDGRTPEVTDSKAFGCGIHWEKEQ